MVWGARADGGRDYFNARWLAFTGRSQAQVVGLGWLDSLHPDDVSACRAAWHEHVAEPHAFALEYRIRKSDREYRLVRDHAAPITDARGALAGWSGSCAEIEPPQAQASRGLEDLFEMSLDHLCVARFDGYLDRINPSWARTLGWTAEEMVSRPSITFVHPDDREATLAGRARLMAGAELGPLVNRYLCKDGTYRWFEWRSVADVGRRLVYAAARDITEQKQSEARLAEARVMHANMQRQLLLADRLSSLGTLAAGVAHEINNPLAVVMANVEEIVDELEALESDPSGAPLRALRKMGIEAQGAAERIQKIVRSLKTFSRADEERRVVLDIQPILERCVEMTRNEVGHRARLTATYGDTPLVEADDGRLAQVIINLLINAAQAIPEGDSAANEILLSSFTDHQGRAVVEVRDTGPGVPASIADRVFDPFFTTKAIGVGTGLGLSICQNIVTGMGGEITLASADPGATTFRVALPAAPAPAAAPVTPPAEPPKQVVPRGAVLVIDDDAAVGAVIARILRAHDVTVVTMARQALELLDGGARYDVILSDLMMPEMSGTDFYAELARRRPEVARRVVFVSGGAFTPHEHAFLDGLENELVEKPFDTRRMRDLVGRYVLRGR